MSAMNNFIVRLQAEIDQSSLTKEQKKLLKQSLKIPITVDTQASDKAINNLANTMLAFKQNNTKMTRSMKKELDSLYDSLINSSKISKGEIDTLRTRFSQLKLEVRDAGRLGKSFPDSIKQGMGSFASWLPASSIVMSSVDATRNAIDNVIELDDSLLELSKVSDLSSAGLEKITNEAYALGATVGKTGKQVIDAATAYKRAGFEMAESMEMAEDALKMTNVAEGIDDASESAQYLISIMKGYRDTSSDFSTKILDSINEVSNTRAVDFDNLADGSQRLSAVANQAGVSFDQMLGTLTGGYEVLGNMEKTASGLITIFTRLQSIQLSDEEEVESVAKLQETFSNATDGVVNIVDHTTGQLRGAYDILNDLNKVWDTLDKNTQEGLAFAAGGTRQKSVFLSLMSNWESVEESVKSATNSIGSAEIENQKYLDSLSGRISYFESAVEHLSSTLVDSNMLKFFIDFGTSGAKALDWIFQRIDPLTVGFGGLIALFNKDKSKQRFCPSWG